MSCVHAHMRMPAGRRSKKASACRRACGTARSKWCAPRAGASGSTQVPTHARTHARTGIDNLVLTGFGTSCSDFALTFCLSLLFFSIFFRPWFLISLFLCVAIGRLVANRVPGHAGLRKLLFDLRGAQVGPSRRAMAPTKRSRSRSRSCLELLRIRK